MDIWNLNDSKQESIIWHEEINTQAYQQATMPFKISTLNKAIPIPLCTIIDPFMKHTQILDSSNAQVL